MKSDESRGEVQHIRVVLAEVLSRYQLTADTGGAGFSLLDARHRHPDCRLSSKTQQIIGMNRERGRCC